MTSVYFTPVTAANEALSDVRYAREISGIAYFPCNTNIFIRRTCRSDF